MIDFIRVHYPDKRVLENWIEENEHFTKIEQVVNTRDGECQNSKKTYYQGFTISINENSGYIKNSIHKSENLRLKGKATNYDDFMYSQLSEAIEFYDNKIQGFASSRLNQFEFGLNISVSQRAEDIIHNNVVSHHGKDHNEYNKYRNRGSLKRFNHYNYGIKIYDKAKQNILEDDLPEGNLLRFEIAFKNHKDFHKLNIYCLNDLLKKPNLESLFALLLKRFDEMDILDEIPRDGSIPKDVEKELDRFYSLRYWEVDIKKFSRNTKAKKRRRFNQLLIQYDLIKTKASIRSALVSKFQFLINN